MKGELCAYLQTQFQDRFFASLHRGMAFHKPLPEEILELSNRQSTDWVLSVGFLSPWTKTN